MPSRFECAGVIALLFTACRPAAPLPPLPEVSTSSFLPSIREAVDAAAADARAHPNDPEKVGRLGMTLHAHQQLGAAQACYRRASLLEPKRFDWVYDLAVVSDGQAAIDGFRAALRLRNYLPAKLRLGEALLAVGDSAGARDVFRGLDHPAALFGYGRATNDPSYYEKALAQFPSYGAAMFALAQYDQRTGKADEARRLMAEYAKFKTTAPHVDDPLLDAVQALNRGPDRLLAEAANLESEGQLAAAANLQLKALELDPGLAQAHINLVSLYGRLDDPVHAEEHYRKSIALKPNAAEAHYNFGVLCYRAHRTAEAKTAFEKALAINPGYAEAHNNLGVLLEEQGRLDQAAQHFERAIELQPDLRLARFHLGRIRANQHRYSQAIEQFERAVDVDDDATPTYLYALGATQARAGDAGRALSTLSVAHQKAMAHGQAALAQSIERDLARLKR